jgi:hypothetical protein
MTDQGRDPARDQAGELIGGETAHAPGIQRGDDLSSIVGAEATDAEGVAAGLARREASADSEPVAPLTLSGASPGDARLRGKATEGDEDREAGEVSGPRLAPGTPTPP